MPLTKLQFKPGVNRELTSYSNEGGWRDGDKYVSDSAIQKRSVAGHDLGQISS